LLVAVAVVLAQVVRELVALVVVEMDQHLQVELQVQQILAAEAEVAEEQIMVLLVEQAAVVQLF
jgi:hypothetical protein